MVTSGAHGSHIRFVVSHDQSSSGLSAELSSPAANQPLTEGCFGDSGSPLPALGPATVYVATMRIGDRDHEEWAAFLDAREAAVAARYSSTSRRTQFIAGRVLAKTVAAGYLDVRPGDIRIDTGEQGKPELSAPRAPTGPSLRFNISHTRCLVACAFSVDAEIGVDVECTSRSILDLALWRFPPEDVALLHSSADTPADQMACRLWTCKEACAKARGTGVLTVLGIPVRRLREEMLVETRSLEDDFILSVAVERRDDEALLEIETGRHGWLEEA